MLFQATIEDRNPDTAVITNDQGEKWYRDFYRDCLMTPYIIQHSVGMFFVRVKTGVLVVGEGKVRIDRASAGVVEWRFGINKIVRINGNHKRMYPR